MAMKELQFPLSKITFLFVFGILVSSYVFLTVFWLAIIVSILFLLLTLFYFFKAKFNYFGIITFVLSFAIGLLTVQIHQENFQENHFIHQIKSNQNNYDFEVLITEKLKKSTSNFRFEAKIVSLNKQAATGKVIVNIKKEQFVKKIPIGYYLRGFGSVFKNRNPNNPNQFDYSKYLEKQQIYGQVFTYPENLCISTSPNKDLNYYAAQVRDKIIFNLQENNFRDAELNIVIALILGQQQDISPEILRDYQYAGAIHVLSVSGLHVGFILLFLTFILKPIPNTKKGSLIKLVLILIGLWSFGFLAGLAPCVLRSVSMFSIVAIGNFINRNSNFYHTLLISILLILLCQPSFLFDVGFQLSYTALFFIAWFQPFLLSFYSPKNIVAKYSWEVLTVSVAAQIGAFPLSLYYFHQFPGLFFITNLIILFPLTIILAYGVVVCILAAFGVVFVPMIRALEWSIWFINQVVKCIASLESFVLQNIPLTNLMLFGLYLFLITSILWLKKPSFQKLVVSLIAFFLFELASLKAKFDVEKSKEFVVFYQKKNTIIGLRNGKNIGLFYNTNSTLDNNPMIQSYLISNFNPEIKHQKVQNCYFFKNQKILVLDSIGVVPAEKFDILILTHSPKINLNRLFACKRPKIVVVDNSNFKSYVKVWKASCEAQKIPFHDCNEKGFFKL